MNYKNKSYLIDFRTYIVAIYIVIYVLSSYIEDILGINQSYQKLLLLGIFLFLTIISESKITDISYLRKLGLSFLILVFLQFFLCPPNQIPIQYIVNILVFLLFAYKSFYYNDLKVISAAIKLAALIVALSVLYNYNLYGYYARQETIVQKQLTSSILTVAYACCWIDIFMGDNNKYSFKWKSILSKYNIINILILIFLLYINVVIVGSKTSLFALGIFAILLYFVISSRYKIVYRRALFIISAFILFFLLAFSIDILNDDIKEGINQLIGFSLYETSSIEKQYNTYSIRVIIMKYCFNLFYQNPIIGIGLGNFSYYNHSFFNDFVEPESSALQVLTEGGIFYVTIILSLLKFPTLRNP